MNLQFSEEQIAIADLAARIFAGGDETWAELGRAQLLGIGIGAMYGGIGGGMLELASLLEQAGKAAAPSHVVWHTVAGMTVASQATQEQQEQWLPSLASGEALFTIAPNDAETHETKHHEVSALSRDNSWFLTGNKTAVPFAQTTRRVLVSAVTPDGPRLFLVDPNEAATSEPQTLTSGEPAAFLTFADALAEPLGDENAVAWLDKRRAVAQCAFVSGMAQRALELTAAHLGSREQFGRPLGTFQAVQQRIADAYIDTEAITWTMWQAAWMLDEGLPADEEVAIAKYWAAEGGHRVFAAAQHLHGGLGVDVDYPLHRYTLSAKQIEMLLGGASKNLAALGDLIA